MGTNACTEVLANITAALYSPKSRVAPPAFAMCPFLNQSMCPALAALPAETVAVVMYNSLAWQRNEWVILYGLPSMHVQVLNASTAVQASQVAPSKDNSSLFDLVFKAAVPPLGYATYFLQPTQGRAPLTYVATVREVGTAEADITIQNPFLAASFASSSGLLSSLTDKVAGYTADVEQGIWWYNASAGYNVRYHSLLSLSTPDIPRLLSMAPPTGTKVHFGNHCARLTVNARSLRRVHAAHQQHHSLQSGL